MSQKDSPRNVNDRKVEVITTGDGSASLYVPTLDETYHSRHGAVQESMHVFIRNGLAAVSKDEIRVLEVGLGTGLNAILAARYADNLEKKVHYSAIETSPLPPEVISQLPNPAPESPELFTRLHKSEWEQDYSLTDRFIMCKKEIRVQDVSFPPETFDCIFYDAFGPRAQPEMWTPEIFRKLFEWTVSGGFWVSYCSRGQVRRDLLASGWVTEKLPGPPGKREMLRAQRG
jgi:tRNA U34 5-methylaminomethyl-2-thiouridine-forming methyltransferase MnmC